MTSSTRSPMPRGLPAMHALASAVVLALGLTAGNAWALALGRATVSSHLGEPLKAEIDIPSITPDEAATLKVSMAPAQALRAANMEYNPLLGSVQIRLQQRADGRTVLRLESDQPVNEPFLDLALEAQWASGRLLRFYTMLFDPPNLKPAAPAPLLPAPAAAPEPRPAPVAAAPTQTTAPAEPQPNLPKAAAPASPPAAPPTRPSADRVTVRRGDTAWRIAYNNRQAGVSLDQMLLAMLRTNPDAFVGNNVNRIKAGAVLQMPSGLAAKETAPEEAQQLIAAQSRDFSEYRRRLAGTAPKTTSEPSGRSAKGVVQSEVAEKKPSAPESDKLTLSKGATEAKGGAEEKIARERQQGDTQARMAELSRNIEELKKLTEKAPQKAAKAPAAPAPAPAAHPPKAVETPPPAVSIETPSTVAQAPVAPAPSPAPATPEPAPAPAPEAPPAPAQPAPPAPPAPASEGPGAGAIIGTLLDNPMTLPAAGGLVALLGLLALMRMRKKKSAAPSNSFLESHNTSDSFFNASGGQTVDTSADKEGAASMMYSLSQLDISGDVDRLAEADVLLAYGREDEAESVLHDALRTQPERTALHLKLLEIHALRQNKAAFEATASEVYTLTGGSGPDWDKVCEMGQALDAGNPLYASTQGATTEEFPDVSKASTAALDLDLSQEPASAEAAPDNAEEPPLPSFDLGETAALTTPEPVLEAPNTAPSQEEGTIDFDMDLSEGVTSQESAALAAALDQELPPEMAEPQGLTAEETEDAFPVDFASATEESPAATDEPASMALDVPVAAGQTADEMAFDLDLSDLEATEESPATAAAAKPTPEVTPPAFDLEDISLDLETPAEPPAEAALPDMDELELVDEGDGSDPLVTKLSLAREFQVIGDIEGARSLAEEVEAEATGELKERARAFLARLA